MFPREQHLVCFLKVAIWFIAEVTTGVPGKEVIKAILYPERSYEALWKWEPILLPTPGQ
jgi:hypothetical protein